MKKVFFLLSIIFSTTIRSHAQQITTTNILGTWDQNIASRAATIIFDDTVRVRFSYKGHTGSTRKYYYVLNNSQTPGLLTVYYKANHRRIRNEYLIQLVDKNRMKLQVLHKKDDRTAFDKDDQKIITLIRRLDL